MTANHEINVVAIHVILAPIPANNNVNQPVHKLQAVQTRALLVGAAILATVAQLSQVPKQLLQLHPFQVPLLSSQSPSTTQVRALFPVLS